MLQRTRLKLYTDFSQYISKENQRERGVVTRRIWGVFVWCFLVPIGVSVLFLVFLHTGALPPKFKAYSDWVTLLSPLVYSAYFFGSEFLKNLPSALLAGGVETTLHHQLKLSEWRDQTCETLRAQLGGNQQDWQWLAQTFRMDLRDLLFRIRYMTALSGVVFFIILYGLDSLEDGPSVSDGRMILHVFETLMNAGSQILLIGLFLVLLYFSGIQIHQSLLRYLDCVELLGKGYFEKRKREDD
ncbi:MAG: hypothetical protein AB7P04_06465 [Bacteriovoracia bacterium]